MNVLRRSMVWKILSELIQFKCENCQKINRIDDCMNTKKLEIIINTRAQNILPMLIVAREHPPLVNLFACESLAAL